MTLTTDHHSHFTLIKKNLPTWLHTASPISIAALKTTSPVIPDWVKNAPPNQQSTLKQAINEQWAAFNATENMMSRVQTPDTFAEPLLKEALKAFDLEIDVRRTFIRLYTPLSIPLFGLKTGAVHTWTVSLLDAALHNFEARETEPNAYDSDSCYTTPPLEDGRYSTLPSLKKTLSIETFTGLCRTLDIGAQYHAYLRENLGYDAPVVEAVLRPLIRDTHKSALVWALEQARAKNDIGDALYQTLRDSLDHQATPLVDGKKWRRYGLQMLGCRLPGILVFSAPMDSSSTGDGRMVVYIPDDPDHPLKEYPSSQAFATELIRQIRRRGYQQFFNRFIAHKDRGDFFSELPQRLERKTHSEVVPTEDSPSKWFEPVPAPLLDLQTEEITGDLWDELFARKMDRLVDNGQDIAVSTELTDQATRWKRWDNFVNVVQGIAQIAAFAIAPFFPPLGAAMMAYSAYQLLDEIFEGIIDWSLGATTQALGHALGVVNAFAQLAAFGGGTVLASIAARALLPAEVTAFFDNLSQVKLKNGQSRLWNRDMGPYEHEISLANDAEPDAIGLLQHDNKNVVSIEGKHYAVDKDPQTGRYVARHPTRDTAYSPTMGHNGKGAWHHPGENPLSWSGEKLVRRLNHENTQLNAETIERAVRISGVDEDSLRKTHFNEESPPALLNDTLKRFKIDNRLQHFIERLQAADMTTEPQTQLLLLSADSRWPKGKVLRFLDESGHTLMEYGNRQNPELPRIQIAVGQLRRGELLKTVLETLDENETRALLGDRWVPDMPSRLIALRERMIEQAQLKKTALFESHYAAFNRTDNGPARLLQKQLPSLPSAIAEELVENATASELKNMLGTEPKVPERLAQEARFYLKETRLARAYEGLYLDGVGSTDTDKLILHTVERLPGWSGQVRLEIREGGFSGRLIDSIGAEEATVRKVLIKDGQYFQAFDDEQNTLHGRDDLYSTILHALPDNARAALDIPQTSQVELFKERILNNIPSREDLRVILNIEPIKPTFRSPMRQANGRPGYFMSGRGAAAASRHFQTREARFNRLYPTLQGIEKFRLEYELFTEESLRAREAEWDNLQTSLDHWTNSAVENIELHSRREVAREIRDCWRRETLFIPESDSWVLRLTPHDIENLPQLGEAFQHVSVLEIHSGTPINNVNAFLQHFPNLRRLVLKNCPLNELPAVARNPGLKELHLEQCDLRLTQDDADSLSNNAQLTFLNLDGNPLGAIPSLSKMSALETLDLSNTGISQIPLGLEHNLLQLNKVNLSGNQITHLPEAVFDVEARQADGYDFSDNPLTQTSRQRVRDYYQKTGVDLGFSPEVELQRATALYPELTVEQAQRFVRQLPRELNASLAELTRLETVYQTMSSDLALWIPDVPLMTPFSERFLTPREIANQQHKRMQFAEKIKACWRRDRSAQNPNQPERYQLTYLEALVGDMPTLDGDFSHVSKLVLVNRGDARGASAFLMNFLSLDVLEMDGFRLNFFPEAVSRMSRLSELTLNDCNISLEPETVKALGRLKNLTLLDLNDNPLELAPDVSSMEQLSVLRLRECSLSRVPEGIFRLGELGTVDLANNQITDLPTSSAGIRYTQSVEYDLRGNPISEPSRQRLDRYFEQATKDAQEKGLVVKIEILLDDGRQSSATDTDMPSAGESGANTSGESMDEDDN